MANEQNLTISARTHLGKKIPFAAKEVGLVDVRDDETVTRRRLGVFL